MCNYKAVVQPINHCNWHGSYSVEYCAGASIAVVFGGTTRQSRVALDANLKILAVISVFVSSDMLVDLIGLETVSCHSLSISYADISLCNCIILMPQGLIDTTLFLKELSWSLTEVIISASSVKALDKV